MTVTQRAGLERTAGERRQPVRMEQRMQLYRKLVEIRERAKRKGAQTCQR
jgi:hypothetical protein